MLLELRPIYQLCQQAKSEFPVGGHFYKKHGLIGEGTLSRTGGADSGTKVISFKSVVLFWCNTREFFTMLRFSRAAGTIGRSNTKVNAAIFTVQK